MQHVLCIYSYLNLLFVLEQRSFHNVAQLERVSFHLEGVTSHLDAKGHTRFVNTKESGVAPHRLKNKLGTVLTDLSNSLPVA